MFNRNIWVCVACDLKFSKRETIVIHSKLHEDEFDVERVTFTDTSCPECDSVSMKSNMVIETRDINDTVCDKYIYLYANLAAVFPLIVVLFVLSVSLVGHVCSYY